MQARAVGGDARPQRPPDSGVPIRTPASPCPRPATLAGSRPPPVKGNARGCGCVRVVSRLHNRASMTDRRSHLYVLGFLCSCVPGAEDPAMSSSDHDLACDGTASDPTNASAGSVDDDGSDGAPSTGVTTATSDGPETSGDPTASSEPGDTLDGDGEIAGLDFPSNGDDPADAFVAAQIVDPQLDGLPIWGPDGAGTTWIWKIVPRHQTGYYVTFWWSDGSGGFLWDGGQANSYYGAHPYPDGGAGGETHDWEIATDYGGDYRDTRLGYGQYKAVVYDQWYTQALRVTRNPDGTKTLVFYTELPSVADGDVIEVPLSAGYGEIDPPSPMITLGDSPWYASYQHERLSGVLRHLKIFDRVLSEDEMLIEADQEEVSAPGIWYRKIDPRPDDLLCDSGTGREFVWADPQNTAALWTGPR